MDNGVSPLPSVQNFNAPNGPQVIHYTPTILHFLEKNRGHVCPDIFIVYDPKRLEPPMPWSYSDVTHSLGYTVWQ